jgi:biotin transport system substrate-specific component
MPSSAQRPPAVPGTARTAPGGDLRRGGPSGLRDTALVAVFAALLAVLAVLPGIPVGPVPVTLATLGVLVAGLVLGPWRGAAACLLYLLVGFVGVPVFAGGASGVGVVVGPSGGYLLAYPLGALVAGALARLGARRGWHRAAGWLLVAAVAASAVVHAAGVLGLVRAGAFAALREAAVFDLDFWPGDLLKGLVAALVAAIAHRAYPDLLVPRRR